MTDLLECTLSEITAPKGTKWRNVVFLKTGRSCASPAEHESEEAAWVHGRIVVQRCFDEPLTLFSIPVRPDFDFFGWMYSHFIPVPWMPR